MKHRYTIAYKGLKEGSHDFEWNVSDDFWTAHPEGGIKGGSVEVRAVLDKTGGAATGNANRNGAMRLRVEIEGSVTTACDRCLEDCELPIDFEGRFVVKFSDEEHPFEGDVMWIAPGETVIDLEQYIYESIVLSLPLQRIHPEDVHGRPLCNPAMLERFKIVSEEEFNKIHYGTS